MFFYEKQTRNDLFGDFSPCRDSLFMVYLSFDGGMHYFDNIIFLIKFFNPLKNQICPHYNP